MSSKPESATERPFVSVIVPAYNDQEGIRRTLESVTAQTFPDESYEVLAIDNNSTDDTRAVIREFCERYSQTVELLIEEQKQGPPAARNRGLKHASGSIIAFIDADMTVEETWLESLTDTMQRNEWDYMGCNVELTSKTDARRSLENTTRYSDFQWRNISKTLSSRALAA